MSRERWCCADCVCGKGTLGTVIVVSCVSQRHPKSLRPLNNLRPFLRCASIHNRSKAHARSGPSILCQHRTASFGVEPRLGVGCFNPMSLLLDTYRKNAEADRAQAEASDLPNIRERLTRSAERWDEMVAKLERVEGMKRP